MKLVYLVEWDAYAQDGVVKKILAQRRALELAGCDAHLVFITPAQGNRMAPSWEGEPHVTRFDYISFGKVSGKFFKSIALQRARRFIAERQPDLLYYRQSSWTPGIVGLLSSSARVVIEMNSDDEAETALEGGVRLVVERYSRASMLRRADGFVSVSREVAEKLARFGKPTLALGNGFDMAAVRRQPAPQNERVQVIFVARPGCHWHGVDRFYALASALPEYDFHLVGIDPDELPANMRSYGHLPWQALTELYGRMDVGVSSLALDRIGITEISPLKAREYIAYGLPVIGAYDDTDLSGEDCFLRINLREGGIGEAAFQMKEFVSSWRGRRVSFADAERLIGSRDKELKRLTFFKRIAGTAEPSAAS